MFQSLRELKTMPAPAPDLPDKRHVQPFTGFDVKVNLLQQWAPFKPVMDILDEDTIKSWSPATLPYGYPAMEHEESGAEIKLLRKLGSPAGGAVFEAQVTIPAKNPMMAEPWQGRMVIKMTTPWTNALRETAAHRLLSGYPECSQPVSCLYGAFLAVSSTGAEFPAMMFPVMAGDLLQLATRVAQQPAAGYAQKALMVLYASMAMVYDVMWMQDRGFMHGDIKPQNFLYVWDPAIARYRIKVADLGSACVAVGDPGESLGCQNLGTSNYTSPELQSAIPRAFAISDVSMMRRNAIYGLCVSVRTLAITAGLAPNASRADSANPAVPCFDASLLAGVKYSDLVGNAFIEVDKLVAEPRDEFQKLLKALAIAVDELWTYVQIPLIPGL